MEKRRSKFYETLLISSAHGSAGYSQFGASRICQQQLPNSSGEYYVPDIVIRYETSARRLIMVNLSDGSVNRVIEENVDILHFGLFSWSPNCRYMVALLENNIDGDDNLPAALWDVQTGTRLLTFDTWEMRLPFDYGLQILWKPDSSQAVIDTDVYRGNHLFLWHNVDNSLMPLIGNGYHFAYAQCLLG